MDSMQCRDGEGAEAAESAGLDICNEGISAIEVLMGSRALTLLWKMRSGSRMDLARSIGRRELQQASASCRTFILRASMKLDRETWSIENCLDSYVIRR